MELPARQGTYAVRIPLFEPTQRLVHVDLSLLARVEKALALRLVTKPGPVQDIVVHNAL